jgi:shikimate kinase
LSDVVNSVLKQHLFLIGYRGTGKSTLARHLSRRLHCPQVDMDRFIIEREGRTIAEIFRDSGEASFRDLETAALRELLERPRHIISTGGGVVLREVNRELLRSGLVIWLRASVENLWQRLKGKPSQAARPALTGLPLRDEIAQLLAERDPLYAACADFTVDTDRLNPQDSVDVIVAHLSRTPSWT